MSRLRRFIERLETALAIALLIAILPFCLLRDLLNPRVWRTARRYKREQAERAKPKHDCLVNNPDNCPVCGP